MNGNTSCNEKNDGVSAGENPLIQVVDSKLVSEGATEKKSFLLAENYQTLFSHQRREQAEDRLFYFTPESTFAEFF